MTILWFALAGAGAIGLGYLIYKRKLSQSPGRVNPSHSAGLPPPPPPPQAGDPKRADGGGPAAWIGAAIVANSAGQAAICAKAGRSAAECAALNKVSSFVVQDTIVKPAAYAWDNTVGRIFG